MCLLCQQRIALYVEHILGHQVAAAQRQGMLAGRTTDSLRPCHSAPASIPTHLCYVHLPDGSCATKYSSSVSAQAHHTVGLRMLSCHLIYAKRIVRGIGQHRNLQVQVQLTRWSLKDTGEHASAHLRLHILCAAFMLDSCRHKRGLRQQLVRKLQCDPFEIPALHPIYGAGYVPIRSPLTFILCPRQW